MGGERGEWDGVEERQKTIRGEHDDPLGVLFHRVNTSEKMINDIDGKVETLTIGFATLKIEMQNLAKDEGKLSGAMYGVGGAIVTGVLLKLLDISFG